MNSVTVAVIALCSFSVAGGGFFLYRQEQENARIEEIKERGKSASHATFYTECDYKGEEIPLDENDKFTSSSGVKSFIIPNGFKVDTYPDLNFTGSKITVGGPSDNKCIDIKSVKVTKANA
jgi:hypothetical protein